MSGRRAALASIDATAGARVPRKPPFHDCAQCRASISAIDVAASVLSESASCPPLAWNCASAMPCASSPASASVGRPRVATASSIAISRPAKPAPRAKCARVRASPAEVRRSITKIGLLPDQHFEARYRAHGQLDAVARMRPQPAHPCEQARIVRYHERALGLLGAMPRVGRELGDAVGELVRLAGDDGPGLVQGFSRRIGLLQHSGGGGDGRASAPRASCTQRSRRVGARGAMCAYRPASCIGEMASRRSVLTYIARAGGAPPIVHADDAHQPTTRVAVLSSFGGVAKVWKGAGEGTSHSRPSAPSQGFAGAGAPRLAMAGSTMKKRK
jgi:hypothetical protein